MSCLACLACQTGSCVLSCCGRTAAIHNSVMTRAVYFIFFVATAALAWVFSIWGNDIFGGSSLFSSWCRGHPVCSNALGPFQAYKVTFAFVVFHLLLALLMIGVKDAHSARGSVHNGWWGPKFLVWAGLIVGFLFLPPGFLTVYAWFSVVGGVLFTIIQLFLLVDFAHTWNESWVSKYHETHNKNWFRLLLVCTLVLLLVTLAGTILMYVFLLGDAQSCPYHVMNIAIVSLNLVLCVTAILVSVMPRIQQTNPRASLLTSSVVVVYATYLIFSALFSEPGCHDDGSHGTVFKYVSLIIGAFITFVAVAFSSIRAGSHQDTAGEHSSLLKKGSTTAMNTPVAGEHDDSGDHDEEDEEKARKRAQEKADHELLKLNELEHSDSHHSEPVQYNYTWFHIVMILGAMYVGCLMTNWAVVTTLPANATTAPAAANNLLHSLVTEPPSSALAVDRSVISTWLKIVASWMVIALYIWTLIAPMCLPDRDFGFER